jgi:hypothetical protein
MRKVEHSTRAYAVHLCLLSHIHLFTMISSRAEPDITSFFYQASVEAAYEKEEIAVDSN